MANDRYPDLEFGNFPDYPMLRIQYKDVDVNVKPLIDQYYEFYNNNDLQSAVDLIRNNPELNDYIINAKSLQQFVDEIIATQRFYMEDFQQYIIEAIRYEGNYNSSIKYQKFSVVNYQTKTYLSIMDVPVGNPPTNTAYWIPWSIKGEQGQSGFGLTPRGIWNSTTQYYTYDFVSHNEKLWYALLDNINSEPTSSNTNWEIAFTLPEAIAIKNQPNYFTDNNVFNPSQQTGNVFGENIIRTVMIGPGWTEEGDYYTHISDSSPLIYGLKENIANDEIQISLNCSYGSGNNGNFLLELYNDSMGNSQNILMNVPNVGTNDTYTFTVLTTGTFTQLRVFPSGDTLGKIKINFIKKITQGNIPALYLRDLPAVVYNNSLHIGGGTEDISGNSTGYGVGSLKFLTSGSNNSSFGSNSQLSVINGNDNTSFGFEALKSNKGGNNNLAIGSGALRDVLNKNNNIGIGLNAGQKIAGDLNLILGNNSFVNSTNVTNNVLVGNDSGISIQGASNLLIGNGNLKANNAFMVDENIILGHDILPNGLLVQKSIIIGNGAFGNSGGSGNNIVIGNGALNSSAGSSGFNIVMGTNAGTNLNGRYNIVLGDSSFSSATDAANNIIIGKQSGNQLTTGTFNIGIGDNSFGGPVTGSYNIALGNSNFSALTTGDNNVGIGYNALNKITYNFGNIAIGRGSLDDLIDGNYNVGIGNNAIGFCQDGENNVGIGGSALAHGVASSGSNNVGIGYGAGLYFSTNTVSSNDSTFIGAESRPQNSNQRNQTVIGYNSVGNGTNTITLGNSDITRLYCKATTITALSDERIKEDIEPANLEICYDSVKNLPVSRYKYKDFVGKYEDKHVTGFMASDVEKIFPKSVAENDRSFNELDENGEVVYEEIEEKSTKIVDGEEKEFIITRKVPKQFTMEKVKDITMTEALPTLWGALQYVIEKLEKIENKVM